MAVKMAKDVGTTIRKCIVVSFLPCLVSFLGFHSYMVPHFFKVFFCNLLIESVFAPTKSVLGN